MKPFGHKTRMLQTTDNRQTDDIWSAKNDAKESNPNTMKADIHQ